MTSARPNPTRLEIPINPALIGPVQELRDLILVRRRTQDHVGTYRAERFVEDMDALGRKRTACVIGKQIVTADATVAGHLAADEGRTRRQNSPRASGKSRSHLLR